MNRNTLFLKTLDDIEKKMKSQDAYEIFMISGLIRKLLIDDYPLVDQVNESKRFKITFKINNRRPPLGDTSLVFWDMHDGFDPNTSVPHLTNPIEVDRNKMLKTQIMIVNGETITVQDLIKYLSNVVGGIHAGKPRSSKEHALHEIQIYVGGLQTGVRNLLSISRVVLKGLEPLRESLKKLSAAN